MSKNLEKLTQAGIVGTPHTISPEDQPLLESLTDDEVNTLIAVKAKLNPHHGRTTPAAAGDPPQPVSTVSF
jgi:hypothetical protein